MKLPSDALIAPEKVSQYLLVKRPIGDKSEFLKQAGYTVDNWRNLEEDIRKQILPEEATLIERSAYGELFEIRAPLVGPNGLTLRVKTIWMQEAGTRLTKFITLYPDRGA